jgi:hypothetical protein
MIERKRKVQSPMRLSVGKIILLLEAELKKLLPLLMLKFEQVHDNIEVSETSMIDVEETSKTHLKCAEKI